MVVEDDVHGFHSVEDEVVLGLVVEELVDHSVHFVSLLEVVLAL